MKPNMELIFKTEKKEDYGFVDQSTELQFLEKFCKKKGPTIFKRLSSLREGRLKTRQICRELNFSSTVFHFSFLDKKVW